MAALLLLILMIAELGFCVYELTRKTTKREWTPRRFIIDSAQLVIFLIMALLPGIDFSFRFKALFFILIFIVGFFFVPV